jgi:hypothetical protein
MPFEDTDQAKTHRVRLFPTIRIGSVAEAEVRATAALLATLRAVSEFGRVLVKLAGGPAGKPDCYTEVPYEDRSQVPPVTLRPDGLLVVTRAGKTWRCLLEVKVGNSPIEREQVEKYLQLAKQENVSALITISNEAAINGGPPITGLNKALVKGLTVVHLSWERLLSEARLLRGQDRVEDEDQQWILDEWIQYVSDASSKIIDPPSLGPRFSDLLAAAKEGNLAGAALAVKDVCGYWDGFLQKVADRLRADLHVDVSAAMTTAERQDNELRLRNLQSTAIGEGRLTGGLKVKNAASEITIDVLLSAKAVRFGIEVKAPSEGRQLTRLKWMTRQLAKAPPEALLHVQWEKKLKSQARMAEALVDVACLTRDVTLQSIPAEAVPRSFSIEWTQDLQKGKGKAVVLDGIMADLEKFYALVVEGIVAFVPRAPKLPTTTTEPTPLADTQVSPIEPAGAILAELEAPAESAVVTYVAAPSAAPKPTEQHDRQPTPSSPPDRAATG